MLFLSGTGIGAERGGARLRCLLAGAVWLSAALPGRAADLFVGPGLPLEEIVDGLAAASPGDRIFVAPGTYVPFDLNQGVEVRGAGSQLVRVISTGGVYSSVRDLPNGAVALIAGMAFDDGEPSGSDLPALLEVANNAGTVVLQGVDINLAPAGAVQAPGLLVTATARLLGQACRIQGSNGPFGSSDRGWPAVDALNSTLDLAGCVLKGGDAVEASGGFSFAGAPGVRVEGGELRLFRTAAEGGRGGFDYIVIVPYAGGPAVELVDSTLVLTGGAGNSLLGGDGGQDGVTAPGGPALRLRDGSAAELAADALLTGGFGSIFMMEAEALDVEAGSSVTELAVNLPSLAPSTGALRLGELFQLVLGGEPGSATLSVASFSLGPALQIPGIAGVVHLNTTALVTLSAEVIDAQGEALLPIIVPTQPALAGASVWFQGVAVDGASLRLSNAAPVLVEP